MKRLFNRIFRGKEALDLVDGNIGRNLWYLALPIVVTNLLRTAYNLADTFWVGRLSTEALAAIGFAFPVIFFLISLGMGWAVAGSVLVAQYTGAERDGRASYAASQTIAFTIISSLILGVAGYFFVGPLTGLLGAEPDVQVLAASYLQIISLGLVSLFGFAVFTALMRGAGDTVTPMLLMFVTVILNIVLDPFIIFGWGPFPALGIDGAAIATIFSRTLALIAGLGIMLQGNRGVTIVLGDMVPDFTFLKKMLRIGIPASVEGTGRSVSINILLGIVGTFSTTVVAGYGIGIRILVTVFLPAIGVERAVETMTGQNIGAGRVERAYETNRVAARWLFGILSVVGIAVFLAAETLVGVFTTDAGVITEGGRFLRYVALTFGFIGVLRAFSGGFRGVGKTLVAAAISLLMLAVIRIPLAWFGSQAFGIGGLWSAFTFSNVCGGLIAYLWYRQSDWTPQLVADETRQKAETVEGLVEYTDSVEAS